MAHTKKISLFYILNGNEIAPPDPQALRRKDEWIKHLQSTIYGKSHRIVRVTYEVFNPEVEQMRKFFNGPVVEYFAIQSADILSGEVSRFTRDKYRETILSDLLGYDVELVGRRERRRKSSGDFENTQQWHDFLESLRETKFDPEGYEFPDSEKFWEIAEKHGYDQAKRIAIEELQKRLIAKNKSPQ